MKNLINYLSKKSLSLGNDSGMTRKRLGNGSGMTRKWFGNDSGMTRFSLASLICLCMLTLGVGNVMGAEDDEHVYLFTDATEYAKSKSAGWSIDNDYTNGFNATKGAAWLRNNCGNSPTFTFTPDFPVKQIIIRVGHTSGTAKTAISISVGETEWKSWTDLNTQALTNYSTEEEDASEEEITIETSFSTCTSTGRGSFCVYSITLIEGGDASSCSTDPSVSASNNSTITVTGGTVTCTDGAGTPKGIAIGDCDIDEYGFVYGTATAPTGNAIKKGDDATSNVGVFSHTFTELNPGTKYYVRAYAKVGSSTFYGTETNFTTKTLTSTSSNTTYGTVSRIGRVITGSVKAGGQYGDPAYTVTGASDGSTTTVVRDGNTFTVTSNSTSNITVTINFEERNCSEHKGDNVISGSSSEYVYGPIDNYYNYSTRQILYTKTDLGLAAGKKGTIRAIYFEYNYSTAMSKKTKVDIYMANTSLTKLATGSAVPYSSFTKVCATKAFNFTSGWNEVELTTPFEYDGMGNLVVLIDDNSGVYEGSSFVFKYHPASTTTGAQIYAYSDGTNVDPSTTDWSTGFNADNYRPNTKFCIEEKDIPKYTVSFDTGTDNPAQAPITETTGGEGITLPNVTPTCSGEGWALYGWATSACSSETTTAPSIVGKADDTYYPTSATTLYAVYAKGEYTKETSSVTSGSKYLIVANYSSKNYILKSSSADYDTETYKMASAQINETSTNKYHAASVNASWSYTIDGSTDNWRIHDVVNATNNYLDIAYTDWWGRAYDKDDPYKITVSAGVWSLNCHYYYNSKYYDAYLSFDETNKLFQSASATYSILLYKAGTINYFSNPTCCTPLGQPATLTLDPTAYTITATWEATSGGNETGYSVQLYDNSGGEKGDAIGDPVARTSSQLTYTFGAKTPVGDRLTANHKYYVGVTPTYSGAGDYCTTGTEKLVSITTDQVYQVTYDGNNKTSGAVPTDANYYEAGDEVTVKTNSGKLVKSGHTFTGWNTANDGSGEHYDADGSTSFTMPSEAVVLYAEWTAKKNYFIDRMHGNWDGEHTEPTTGYNCYLREGAGYTVPDLSDDATGSNSCVTGHAHFVGWVASGNIDTQGGLKSGYTIIKGGTSGTASVDGTIYYAVWAEE